ncbi:hypothetical protein [Streptomyces niveus]|uniref:hypothetical protein n=1 Tax=Streptomyces niveus TaxID=193462 RepID=UPI003436494D
MTDVPPAWAAISGWLATHAPASHATLRPGAAAGAIRSTEDQLGAPLPPDLVTLLRTCNGTVDASAVDRDPDEYDPGLFLAQHHLLPLEAIRLVRGTGESADEFWGEWVPFAVADYAVAPWGGLAIEPGGRLSTFSQANGEPPSQPPAGHASLAEFLNALAEALTRGTGPLTAPAGPGIHQGALLWGPLPGDGTLWTPVHTENEPTA